MVILLSGTINSGKTVCARSLAHELEGAVVVEIDQFFQFFAGEEAAAAGEGCLRLAADCISRLVWGGHDVIVPYPLWEKDIRILLDELERVDADIHLVTLAPAREVVLEKRSKRNDKQWERQVVAWHEDLGITRPIRGEIIDNTYQHPWQTVRAIVSAVASGKSLIREAAGEPA